MARKVKLNARSVPTFSTIGPKTQSPGNLGIRPSTALRPLAGWVRDECLFLRARDFRRRLREPNAFRHTLRLSTGRLCPNGGSTPDPHDPQRRDGRKGRRWCGPAPLTAAGNVTIVMLKTSAAIKRLNARESFGVNNANNNKSGARHIPSKTRFCSKSHLSHGCCFSI